MENDNNPVNEISVYDLIIILKSKLKYIFFIPLTLSVIFFLVKLTDKKEYKSSLSIVANLEKESFKSQFGEYEFVSTKFEDYSSFILSDIIIDKTISDLNLNFSISELKSGLDYKIKPKSERGESWLDIELVINDTISGKILNTHVINFINYLNSILDKNVISKYISGLDVLIADKEEAIKNIGVKISKLDSILKETPEFRLNEKQFSSIFTKNIIIDKSVLVNDAYLKIEDDLVKLRTQNESDKITIKTYSEQKQFLKDLLNEAKAVNNKFISHFNVLNDYIIVINRTESHIKHVSDILKKSITFFIVTFLIVFLFFLFKSMIALNRKK